MLQFNIFKMHDRENMLIDEKNPYKKNETKSSTIRSINIQKINKMTMSNCGQAGFTRAVKHGRTLASRASPDQADTGPMAAGRRANPGPSKGIGSGWTAKRLVAPGGKIAPLIQND
jgi:hypothetical protein